jgi:DNA modification methylase
MGIPWRVAFALQADGWYLRQDIIWSKPNPMPESVRDRCTKAHEYLFLLSKSERYHYDADAIAEPAVKAGQVLHSYGTGAKDRQDVSEVNDRRTRIGLANWNQAQPETRNRRSVWEVTTAPFAEAHFATFPPALIEPCILAGCPKGGTVLDPFGGAGTTGLVADRLGRNAILIELNPEYADMAERRIRGDAGMFAGACHP